MMMVAAPASSVKDVVFLQASLQLDVNSPTEGRPTSQKPAAFCQECFSGPSDDGHYQNRGASKDRANTAGSAMMDAEKERDKDPADYADVQAGAATSRSHRISILEDSPSAFTIRGYVAAVREKDIARCWPFSPWLLKQRRREGSHPLLPPLVDDVACTDGSPTPAPADNDFDALNIVAPAADDDDQINGSGYNHEEASDLQVQLPLDLSKSEAQLLNSAVEDGTNTGPATTGEAVQKIIEAARTVPCEKTSSDVQARETKASPHVPSHAPVKIKRQVHRSIRDIRKSVMEGPCHCHQYCSNQSITVPRPQELHVRASSYASSSYDNNAEERPSIDEGASLGCLLDDATMVSETYKVRTGACSSHVMGTFAGNANSPHDTNQRDIADANDDLKELGKSHIVTEPDTNVPMQLEKQESHSLLQVQAKRLEPDADKHDDSNGASCKLTKYAAPQCVAEGGHSLMAAYSNDRNSENSCHDNDQNDPDDADHASITVPLQKCPVCLVFQCSSNTALNAHIDHCLASFSHDHDMQMSKPKCPKTKARKKRSIAELYCVAAPPSYSKPDKEDNDDADDIDEEKNDDDHDTFDEEKNDHDRHQLLMLSPSNYSGDEKRQKRKSATSLMSSRSSQDLTLPTMKRNCNIHAIAHDTASKEGKTSAEGLHLMSQKNKNGDVKKSRLSGSATKRSSTKVLKVLKSPSPYSAGATYQVSDTRNDLSARKIDDLSTDRSTRINIQQLLSYFEEHKDNSEPDENADQGILESSIDTWPKVKTTLKKPIDVVHSEGRQNNGGCKSSPNPTQRSPVLNLDQSTFKMISGIEQTSAEADNLLCATTGTNSVDKSDTRERPPELIPAVQLPTIKLPTASQKVALFADCMEVNLNTINHEQVHQVQHHDSILQGHHKHVPNSLRRLDEPTAIRNVHSERQSQDKEFLVNRKTFPFQTGHRVSQEDVPESCSLSSHQVLPFSESRIVSFSSSPLIPSELTPGFQNNNKVSLPVNSELNQIPVLTLHEVDGPILTHAVINYNGMASCQRQPSMPKSNYLQAQSQQTNFLRECQERYIPRPMLPPIQVLELSTSLHTCRNEESVPAERHYKFQNSATHQIATQVRDHIPRSKEAPYQKAQPERYSTKLPPWMQAALNDHKSASFASLDVTASDQSSLSEIPSSSRDTPTGPAILDAAGKSVLRLMGKTMVLSHPRIQNDNHFYYSPHQSESTTTYANIWPSLGPQNQNYQQLLQSGNHLGSLSSSLTFLDQQTSHEHLVHNNCDLMWVSSGSCAQPPVEVRTTPNDKCNTRWVSSNRCYQSSSDNIILQSSMGSYHGSHNFVTPSKSFSTIPNKSQEHPLQASLSQAAPSFLNGHEAVTRNFMTVPPTSLCQECEPHSSRRTCETMHSRLAMQENPVNSAKAPSQQWLTFSNQILPDFHKCRCEPSTICSWISDARQRDKRKEPPEVVIIDDDDGPTSSDKPNQASKVHSTILGSRYTNTPIQASLHVSENSAKNTPMETAWELANPTDIDTNKQALAASMYQNENLGFSGTGSKVTFLDLVKQQSSKKSGNSQSIVNLSRRRNCSHLSRNWKFARTSESGFPGNLKGHDCSPIDHVLQSWDGTPHTSRKAASNIQAIKAAVEKLHMDECRNWAHSSEAPLLKRPCQHHQRNAASSFGIQSSCSYDYPDISDSTDPSQKGHSCMKPTGSSLGICSTNMNPAEMECAGCWPMRLQSFPFTLEHDAPMGGRKS